MKKIRKATKEDMKSIYMMGFDVWGDNMSSEKYIAICQESSKYQKGTWYTLEDLHTKELLSSLIVYELSPSKDIIVKGLGSIATPLQFRKKGHASLLVKEVINELEQKESCNHFFLYSDIGADFYSKLGFMEIPYEKQKYKESVCMYYSQSYDVDSISFEIPNYF
ncbi:putative acetyltransferase [Metabacillus crassostreae]|uniref:hypothetical protein n=1 Tax=Metabacillus crassostreae TaxID=929098 RepID=UPI00195E57AA|nr:hypothetical protein [Metabacillus crassostreae]MBM7602482.1 putative acetyltransferase [Metabacillus crassostreae]